MLTADVVERVAGECRARAGLTAPPFCSRAAIDAARPRIVVIEEPRLPRGIDCATTVLDRGPAIFVQPNLSAPRRRLALACGLGHVLLDEFPLHPGPPMLRDFAAEERAEVFALALLVPRALLRRRAVQPICARRLALVFGVPEWAMTRRLDLVLSA